MKIKLFVLFSVLISSAAFAEGGNVGNGGISHVCRSAKGKVKSVELLDFYRGRVELGLEFAADANRTTEEVEMRNASERLSDSIDFYTLIRKEYVGISLGPDYPLLSTDDGNPPPAQPGCSFEQLAVMTPGGNTLLVQPTLHGALSIKGQAALKTHEILYRLARKHSNVSDSVDVQRLVAYMYSVEENRAAINALVAKLFPGVPELENCERTIPPTEINGKDPVVVRVSTGMPHIKNDWHPNGSPIYVKLRDKSNVYRYLPDIYDRTISPDITKEKQPYDLMMPIAPNGLRGSAIVLSSGAEGTAYKVELLQGGNVLRSWDTYNCKQWNSSGPTVFILK